MIQMTMISKEKKNNYMVALRNVPKQSKVVYADKATVATPALQLSPLHSSVTAHVTRALIIIEHHGRNGSIYVNFVTLLFTVIT